MRNISQKQNVKIEGNISGVINVISPIANFQSKKIEIEIIVNNSDKRLTPETFVTVEIPTQNQPSNLVPLKALIVTQNESYVFVVENNKAIKKIVITKETQGSFIEVTGLLMTEILIVNGARDLENLEEIKVEYDN